MRVPHLGVLIRRIILFTVLKKGLTSHSIVA